MSERETTNKTNFGNSTDRMGEKINISNAIIGRGSEWGKGAPISGNKQAINKQLLYDNQSLTSIRIASLFGCDNLSQVYN